MLRPLLLSFSTLFVLANLAVACVGEDVRADSDNPDGGSSSGGGADARVEGGPAQGSEGAECFPNQTCLVPLSCASNLCVDLTKEDSGGGTTDSGEDGSVEGDSSDGSSQQPMDAGADGDAG